MKEPGENLGPEYRHISGRDKGGRVIPTLKEIIEEKKEAAIESLSVSFAENRLPLEEYERLAEYIHKIESERELAVVEKIVAEYRGNDPRFSSEENSGKINTGGYEDKPDYSRHLQAGISLAMLSTRTISGPLESGSRIVTVLGGHRLKIRKADLARGRTDIEVVTILGDCVIFVEPGIRLVNKSIPILGESLINRKVTAQIRDGDRELFISGVTLLGNITIKPLRE